MIKKAESNGLYENFGQDEIRQLRERVGFNPYGTEKERETAAIINELENWAANLNIDSIKN